MKIGPDDPRYAALVGRGFNKRFAGKPDYVRLVHSTDEVIDAVQEAVREGRHGQWRLEVLCTAQDLQLHIAREGTCAPTQDTLVLRLPAAECRPVRYGNWHVTGERVDGTWREITLAAPRSAGTP